MGRSPLRVRLLHDNHLSFDRVTLARPWGVDGEDGETGGLSNQAVKRPRSLESLRPLSG